MMPAMGLGLTIAIPPGPAFYIEGPDEGEVAALDELERLLGRIERVTVTRPQRHQLCVFVEDYNEREAIMSRVEAWCGRKGLGAERDKW